MPPPFIPPRSRGASQQPHSTGCRPSTGTQSTIENNIGAVICDPALQSWIQNRPLALSDPSAPLAQSQQAQGPGEIRLGARAHLQRSESTFNLNRSPNADSGQFSSATCSGNLYAGARNTSIAPNIGLLPGLGISNWNGLVDPDRTRLNNQHENVNTKKEIPPIVTTMRAHTEPVAQSQWTIAPVTQPSKRLGNAEIPTAPVKISGGPAEPWTQAATEDTIYWPNSFNASDTSDTTHEHPTRTPDSTSGSSAVVVAKVESSLGAQMPHGSIKPPVWEQERLPHSFKLRDLGHGNVVESFRGSFKLLAAMNPDTYQLPLGSRVVSIKTAGLSNVIRSIEHGLWACPGRVTERIANLYAKKQRGEKLLFFFSISGSKQYCGIAEVESFEENYVTSFWNLTENDSRNTSFESAFKIRWVYCKTVPFDTIRRVDSCHEGDSVTQMWNGMHYDESIGRDVIRAYVEAPHLDNLLMRNLNEAAHTKHHGRRHAPGNTQRLHQIPHARDIRKGVSRQQSLPQLAPLPGRQPPLMPNMSHRRPKAAPNGAVAATMGPGQPSRQNSMPAITLLHCVQNADGTLRPATYEEMSIHRSISAPSMIVAPATAPLPSSEFLHNLNLQNTAPKTPCSDLFHKDTQLHDQKGLANEPEKLHELDELGIKSCHLRQYTRQELQALAQNPATFGVQDWIKFRAIAFATHDSMVHEDEGVSFPAKRAPVTPGPSTDALDAIQSSGGAEQTVETSSPTHEPNATFVGTSWVDRPLSSPTVDEDQQDEGGVSLANFEA